MNTIIRYKEKMKNTLIQIWGCVMLPKVWIFVGLVSAGIGLICFAHSSSFNHLFGDWNFLKIFLYCLVSFIIIIILIILFANKWQLSTSRWFKVSANVLVITLTSFYSYYLEEKVRGKPDAYSLISYAAFTITSLSLLLQNRCGFGKELMEFFVACFIVQFMKIKLVFFIPGACFYYIILGVYLSGRNRNGAIVAESHSTQLASTTDNEDSTSLQEEYLDVIVDPHSPQLTSTDIGISSMLDKLSDYVKQKIVIKMSLNDQKSRYRAMKIAAGVSGVEGTAIQGDNKDQIEVTGEGVDSVKLTSLLRKKFGYAKLVSVGDVGKPGEKKEEKKVVA